MNVSFALQASEPGAGATKIQHKLNLYQKKFEFLSGLSISNQPHHFLPHRKNLKLYLKELTYLPKAGAKVENVLLKNKNNIRRIVK